MNMTRVIGRSNASVVELKILLENIASVQPSPFRIGSSFCQCARNENLFLLDQVKVWQAFHCQNSGSETPLEITHKVQCFSNCIQRNKIFDLATSGLFAVLEPNVESGFGTHSEKWAEWTMARTKLPRFSTCAPKLSFGGLCFLSPQEKMFSNLDMPLKIGLVCFDHWGQELDMFLALCLGYSSYLHLCGLFNDTSWEAIEGKMLKVPSW